MNYFGSWGEACSKNYARDFWEAIGRAKDIDFRQIDKIHVVRRQRFNEQPLETLTIFGNRDYRKYKKFTVGAKQGWQAPKARRLK